MDKVIKFCPLTPHGSPRACAKDCAWYMHRDSCCAVAVLAKDTRDATQALLLIKDELKGGINTYEQNL